MSIFILEIEVVRVSFISYLLLRNPDRDTYLNTRSPADLSAPKPPGPLSIRSLCDMHMMTLSVDPQTFSTAASMPVHIACWICQEPGPVIWS